MLSLVGFTSQNFLNVWKPARKLSQFRVILKGRSSKRILVSKETGVLRRWERSKQKFGLSNELIKVKLPPCKI